MKDELRAYYSSSLGQRIEKACESLINSISLEGTLESSYRKLKELEYTLQLILLLENINHDQPNSQITSIFKTQYINMDVDNRILMYSTLVDEYVTLSAFLITSAKNTSNLAFASNEQLVNRVAGKYRYDLNLSLDTSFTMKPWLSFRMFSDSSFGSTNEFTKEKPFKNQSIIDFSIHFCKANKINYLIGLDSDYICGVCAYQHTPLTTWSKYYTMKEELESNGISFSQFYYDEMVPGRVRLSELYHTILKDENFDLFFENCLKTFWDNNPIIKNLIRYS